MDFHHLKDQLKQFVGARRGRGARPHDDPQAEEHEGAEELEREIEEAFGIRRDVDQESTEWDRSR